MLVPNTALRSVVFIGDINSEGAFTPRATGFLVRAGEGLPGSVFFHYLVTAEHVISGMVTKRMSIHCRINLKNGEVSTFPLSHDEWWFHPDTSEHQTDVAVLPLNLRTDLVDHDYIPLINRPVHIDRIPRLGEEVFIMGLFKNHYGEQRNVPIVRIGNIAAIPHEPVYTKYCGDIDAYLVELRSIAGISGSPVFKNAEGKMPYPKNMSAPTNNIEAVLEERRKLDEIDWYDWHFVGLVHGHFDVRELTEDVTIEDDDSQRSGINTGIGIVIPASKILETLFQPDLLQEQYEMSRKAQPA